LYKFSYQNSLYNQPDDWLLKDCLWNDQNRVRRGTVELFWSLDWICVFIWRLSRFKDSSLPPKKV